MNFRHTAALALVVWYLMLPPALRVIPDYTKPWVDTNAPASKWNSATCQSVKNFPELVAPSFLFPAVRSHCYGQILGFGSKNDCEIFKMHLVGVVQEVERLCKYCAVAQRREAFMSLNVAIHSECHASDDPWLKEK